MMVIHTYDHPIHSNILEESGGGTSGRMYVVLESISGLNLSPEGLGSRPTIPTDPWDRWVEMATTMVNIISVTVT